MQITIHNLIDETAESYESDTVNVYLRKNTYNETYLEFNRELAESNDDVINTMWLDWKDYFDTLLTKRGNFEIVVNNVTILNCDTAIETLFVEYTIITGEVNIIEKLHFTIKNRGV